MNGGGEVKFVSAFVVLFTYLFAGCSSVFEEVLICRDTREPNRPGISVILNLFHKTVAVEQYPVRNTKFNDTHVVFEVGGRSDSQGQPRWTKVTLNRITGVLREEGLDASVVCTKTERKI